MFVNLGPSAHNLFNIIPDADTQNIPYDYDSIMHFKPNAFSRNGRDTIVALNNIERTRLGQRQQLSELDIQQINVKYCPGKDHYT